MPTEGRIPGKLIIELTPEVNQFVPPFIPEDLQAPAQTSFGNPILDAALTMLPVPVRSITKLFGNVEYDANLGIPLVEGMRATYVVRFHPAIDLDAAISVLRTTPGVQHVDTVSAATVTLGANDPFFLETESRNQWGLHKIRAPEAWERTIGTSDVKIAVVDTGCDYHHPDLRLVGGRDFCEDPEFFGGWVREGDFTSPDWDPQDELGHGTNMAGIIGASTNNGIGMAGVTWLGIVQPVRIAARAIKPGTTSVRAAIHGDELAKGIRYAADWCRVINVSLEMRHSRELDLAVQYAIRKKALVVASMGNNDILGSRYPAAYPGVLAVGAIDEYGTRPTWRDENGALLTSNTGWHMSVVAPGKDIWTTDLFTTYGSPQYACVSGTSPAAAFVSGVAALIYGCNDALTPSLVKTIIEETASKGALQSDGLPWPNAVYGHGLVDARAAVDRVLDLPFPPP